MNVLSPNHFHFLFSQTFHSLLLLSLSRAKAGQWSVSNQRPNGQIKDLMDNHHTFTYNLLFFSLAMSMPNLVQNHRFYSKPDETLVQGFTGLRMCFNVEYVMVFTEDQLLMLEKDHMAGLYDITVIIWLEDTHFIFISFIWFMH